MESVLAAMIVTVLLLTAAALIRNYAVPKFTHAPGRFQLFLEQMVAAADALGAALAKAGWGLVRAVKGLGLGIVHLAKAIAGIRLSQHTRRALIVWALIAAVPLALSIVVGPSHGHLDIQTAMRDAVLHDVNRISLFGWKEVNPGLIAAMTVSGVLLLFALVVRVFAIPRFRETPGSFQLLLEQLVGLLDGLAKAPVFGRTTFVGAYVFAAGCYIFIGTLFELLGIQAVAVNGVSVTLPAPLSDVNAAICMGCLSYLVIFSGGVRSNGLRGAGAALKEFSLPISMSFRLFGALLSGLLVTDLIYHYAALSYGLPVVVGVMFTLLHALIQTYVLTMLVGMYYEEVSEPLAHGGT